MQPIIKWYGSKRSQAEQTLNHFPVTYNTYYEPFVGGGSIFISISNSSLMKE